MDAIQLELIWGKELCKLSTLNSYVQHYNILNLKYFSLDTYMLSLFICLYWYHGYTWIGFGWACLYAAA